MSLRYCSLVCDCEKGFMFKTSLSDEKNRKVMFALLKSEPEDFFQYTLMIFKGYCTHCGKSFQYDIWLEGLIAKEVES